MTTYEFLVTQKQLKSILNNENFQDTIFNLYDRWQDEHDYEDIKDYAKPLENIVSRIICKDIKLTMTKRPFGFKFRSNYAFTTKTGELSIKAGEITFIAKGDSISYKVKLINK